MPDKKNNAQAIIFLFEWKQIHGKSERGLKGGAAENLRFSRPLSGGGPFSKGCRAAFAHTAEKKASRSVIFDRAANVT